MVRLADRLRPYGPAVAEDRHLGGDPKDLLQAVGHEQDATARRGVRPHAVEELVGLAVRQDGGGFVKDDEPGRARECERQLDELLLSTPLRVRASRRTSISGASSDAVSCARLRTAPQAMAPGASRA